MFILHRNHEVTIFPPQRSCRKYPQSMPTYSLFLICLANMRGIGLLVGQESVQEIGMDVYISNLKRQNTYPDMMLGMRFKRYETLLVSLAKMPYSCLSSVLFNA